MLNQLLGGRYRVVQVLGEGGLGKTYIVKDHHRLSHPQCVVKFLKPASNAPDFLPIAKRLFHQEAEILEKLGQHEQIPRLLAYFEENQEFYLVQELIEGQTLSKELLPGKPWSESQVIQMLQDVLPILEFVHSHGVIHRDIKPSNLIRRTKDGRLVLIDFGAVKQVSVLKMKNYEPLTQPTIPIGTQGYLPLEQLIGQPRLNSDIYALGMIGIQALTGVEPLSLSEDEDGEPLWSERAEVSDELATILSKMVRYHFPDRYQSATEVLQALQVLAQNYTFIQPPSPTQQTRAQVVSEKKEKVSGAEGLAMLPNSSSSALGANEPTSSMTTKLFIPQGSVETDATTVKVEQTFPDQEDSKNLLGEQKEQKVIDLPEESYSWSLSASSFARKANALEEAKALMILTTSRQKLEVIPLRIVSRCLNPRQKKIMTLMVTTLLLALGAFPFTKRILPFFEPNSTVENLKESEPVQLPRTVPSASETTTIIRPSQSVEEIPSGEANSPIKSSDNQSLSESLVKEPEQVSNKSPSLTSTPVTQVSSVEPKRIPVQPQVVPTNSEAQTRKAEQQREVLKKRAEQQREESKRKAEQQREALKKRAEQQREWGRRGEEKGKGKGKGKG
ncbi:MAG: protein kinase [Xenococcaceae cyanobacterium]